MYNVYFHYIHQFTFQNELGEVKTQKVPTVNHLLTDSRKIIKKVPDWVLLMC